MLSNSLSNLNTAYISNIKNDFSNDTITKTSALVNIKQDKEDEGLKKALLGLGITGAAIVLGAGVYFLSKGKTKPPKTNIPISNPAQSTNIPTTSSILNLQKYSIENLGNGRIKAVLNTGNVNHKPIELPEYLYHITSEESMKKIVSSGILKISKNEQLKGLYFLDSKNFLSHYKNTNINGENKDLLSAIFRQANKGNKNGSKNIVIIKIPTADLLQNGKLRIRTQEDFFTITEVLKDVEKKTGKNYTLRSLCDDTKREEFKTLLVSSGIVNKAQCDSFMRNMEIKIHQGHSLSNAVANNFENKYSIEYIFNKDIKLSNFPNIQTQTITPKDYLESDKKHFNPNKVKTIFEGNFEPL